METKFVLNFFNTFYDVPSGNLDSTFFIQINIQGTIKIFISEIIGS